MSSVFFREFLSNIFELFLHGYKTKIQFVGGFLAGNIVKCVVFRIPASCYELHILYIYIVNYIFINTYGYLSILNDRM